MAGMIVQQPNGLYCRFSTIVDCPTHWNMTLGDYTQVIMSRGRQENKAKEEAVDIIKNHLYPFDEMLKMYVPNNMKVEEFKDIIKQMGYEKEFIYLN